MGRERKHSLGTVGHGDLYFWVREGISLLVVIAFRILGRNSRCEHMWESL